jgi:6-phospho-3-hexuloisomerase
MRLNEQISVDLQVLENIFARFEYQSFEPIIDEILKAEHIFLCGAGRTGLIMEALAMRLVQVGLRAHVVGSPTAPAAAKNDLLILASATGETDRVRVVAEKAQELGIPVYLITANLDSSIASIADQTYKIPTDSGKAEGTPDSSMLTLRSAFEQALLILLDSIVAIIAGRLGKDRGSMLRVHANL